MMKKYVLFVVMLAAGLSNSMNGMESSQPSAWNRFKTWLFSSPRDVAERKMPQIPPHPVYPQKEEVDALKAVFWTGTGEKATGDVKKRWEGEGWIGKDVFPYKGHTHWVHRSQPGASLHYSNEIPTRENLQELKRQMNSAIGELELLGAQRRLESESHRQAVDELRKEVRRAEVQKAGMDIQRRYLQPYAVSVEKWLNKKDKVLAQQALMRARADYETQKRKETYKRIISSLGNE